MYLRMYILIILHSRFTASEFVSAFGTFVVVKIHRLAAFGTGLLRKSVDFIVITHIVAFFKEKIVSQLEGKNKLSAFGTVKSLLFFYRQSIDSNIADTEHNLRCRLEKV